MKLPEIAPEKLKYFTLVFSLATIGCYFAGGIILGYFGYLGWSFWPIFSLIYSLISSEARTSMAQHNAGYIILYVCCALYGLTSIGAIWYVLTGIFNGGLAYLSFYFFVGGAACHTIASLTTFLLCHNIRESVVSGGQAPLIDSTV